MANSTDAGGSILAPILPTAIRKIPRQVFVAYPYALYPKEDYRKVYKEVAKAFDVKFIFADERITSLHILQKIANYIASSQFGIYDISGWNANVTLELGIAFGYEETTFIAMDPSKTPVQEVPADLRGIDRIQYGSYSELQEKLESLIAQELPISRAHEAENQLNILREEAVKLVGTSDGLGVAAIAKALGINTDLAKVVIKPLVGAQIQSKGRKRGTKYFPM